MSPDMQSIATFRISKHNEPYSVSNQNRAFFAKIPWRAVEKEIGLTLRSPQDITDRASTELY